MANHKIGVYNPQAIDKTQATKATSRQEYVSPETRALKEHSSIFGAAKQLHKANAGSASSYASTESSTKTQGKEAANDTQGFNKLTDKIKADENQIKEKTSSIETRTVGLCSTITRAGQKIDSLNAKNVSIDKQIASLQEGEDSNSNAKSNPFAVYSLKTAGEASNTGNKVDSLLGTNSQDTKEGSETTETNQNQAKIVQLNTQKVQNTRTMKAEGGKAQNIFNAANQKYKADMSEINDRKKEVAKEIENSKYGQNKGTEVAGIGKGVEALGDMMIGCSYPPVSAAGAVIKPVGTATNIAGVGLNLAATGSLNQAQNKSTEVDKAAANALKQKQRAAQVYVNALKRSKTSKSPNNIA